jgi:hypothetical protein
MHERVCACRLLALHAETLFLVSAALIHSGRRGNAPECYTYIHPNDFFEVAAANAIFASGFGILSYKMLRVRI